MTSNMSSKKSINIIMLNYEFPPLGGGAGNATYYLLKKFVNYSDLKIDLVTSSTDGFRIEKFAENITIHFLDIKKKNANLHYQTIKDLLIYTLKAYRYVRNFQNKNKYDLCHAFFGIPNGLIALWLHIPYIVSLRGSDVPFYNSRFYWFDKLALRRVSKKVWEHAEKVVANSEDLKKLAQKTVQHQQIKVIHNGVDTDQFVPAKNKSLSEKVKLISTGRLIERKGYVYLIKALKKNRKAELTLIGDGNLANSLKTLADKNNVDVKFVGTINHENLPDYLCMADIFVLPSLNEGMSNAILEAMACGLPIIATDTGGSRELIKGNGYIVSKGSSVDLEKAIKHYLVNKKLIKTHGIKSRKLAQDMNWDKVANEYWKIYHEGKSN